MCVSFVEFPRARRCIDVGHTHALMPGEGAEAARRVTAADGTHVDGRQEVDQPVAEMKTFRVPVFDARR